MKVEGTVKGGKKQVYTKPGLRPLHTMIETSRGNCDTGTVALFNPKKEGKA